MNVYIKTELVLQKKEDAIKALHNAKWQAMVENAYPSKEEKKRNPINYSSPNVRERLGFCHPLKKKK